MPGITDHSPPIFNLNFEYIYSPANQVWYIRFNNSEKIFVLEYKLHTSIDKGLTWETFSSNYGLTSIAVSPFDDYAVLGFGGVMGGGGIYLSDDNGTNWKLNESIRRDDVISCAFIDTGKIFVGLGSHDESSGGLTISTDYGKSWIEAGFNEFLSVLSIFPVTKSLILLGCILDNITDPNHGPQVYYSSNGGDQWELAQIDSNMKMILTFEISSNDIILAGTYGSGIYFSSDLGTSWNYFSHQNHLVYDIAISKENYIFVASQSYMNDTMNDFLSYSLDFGKTWAYDTSGVYGRIEALEIDEDNYLYIGSSTGLYRSSTKTSKLK